MAKKVLTPTPKFKPGDLLRINSGGRWATKSPHRALSCYTYFEDSDGNPAAVSVWEHGTPIGEDDIVLFIKYFIADDGIYDVIVLNGVLCEVPEKWMEKV